MTDTTALIELQIKVAYLEHTLEALNDVIVQQDRLIKDLQDQLRLLYRQLESRADTTVAPFDLLADRPPHY